MDIRSACKRYGPGRLPGANNPAIGTGYAGASAALLAALVFAVVAAVFGTFLGLPPGLFGVQLAALALPLIVPGGFVVGFVGWKVARPRTAPGGVAAGVLGAFAVYGLSMLGLAALVVGMTALAGDDILRAAVFAWGVTYIAFIETWWVALPIGGVSGFVHVRTSA